MKKIILITISGVLIATTAWAAVNITSGPTSLVANPAMVGANSAPLGLFAFTVDQTAGEILSSVTVQVNNAGFSTATSADIASVAVYKDNGNGTFSTTDDLPTGNQGTVNIGSNTIITTSANNSISAGGSKFFVSITTAGSWSSANVPVDSITITLPTNGIVTSANSPTVIAVTTATITADTVGPRLISVKAKNTGGTTAKEAGDSVILTFNEGTNKAVINDNNINSTLSLNNYHSWLDGAGHIGSSSWNDNGTMLTIVLSGITSLPTVAIGDKVTIAGAVIKDAAQNNATKSAVINGSFKTNQADDGNKNDNQHGKCKNNLINGRIYKQDGKYFLSVACRLKEFKGKAIGKARGKKFQNIIDLPDGDDEDDD